MFSMINDHLLMFLVNILIIISNKLGGSLGFSRPFASTFEIKLNQNWNATSIKPKCVTLGVFA